MTRRASSTGCGTRGSSDPGVDLDAERLLDYLAPILEPARAETFRFSRAWLRSQAVRVGDPRSPAYSTGLQLNLPPEYLLIHRVTAGAIGVLCQLEAEARGVPSWSAGCPASPGRRKPDAQASSRVSRSAG